MKDIWYLSYYSFPACCPQGIKCWNWTPKQNHARELPTFSHLIMHCRIDYTKLLIVCFCSVFCFIFISFFFILIKFNNIGYKLCELFVMIQGSNWHQPYHQNINSFLRDTHWPYEIFNNLVSSVAQCRPISSQDPRVQTLIIMYAWQVTSGWNIR